MLFRPIRQARVDAPTAMPFADDGHIMIGARIVPRAAVRSVVTSRRVDRDIDGQLFNFSIYLIIALVFLTAVLEFDWRSRFLLATAFFAIVGSMSLVDVFAANRISYWRIDVVLHSGETLALAVHGEAERDRWVGYVTGRQ